MIIDKIFDLISKVPTTATRVVITILLTIATGVMYFATAFIPSYEWLGFLALMSGLDVAQFYSKRKTSWSPIEYAEADRIRNGHSKPIPTLEEGMAGEEEMG